MIGYGTGKRSGGGAASAAMIDLSGAIGTDGNFIGPDLASWAADVTDHALIAELGDTAISGGRATILEATGDGSAQFLFTPALHAGRVILLADAEPVEIVLDGAAVGDHATLIQAGAGALTFTVPTGALINGVAEAGAGEASVSTANAWDSVEILRLSDDGTANPRFLIVGDLA